MRVTFVKKGARRYGVEVGRERYPDLWCGSIGYDEGGGAIRLASAGLPLPLASVSVRACPHARAAPA